MNKTILLLLKDEKLIDDQIKSFLNFFTKKDKIILALNDRNNSEEWPFKFYDLGWSILNKGDIAKKLNQATALKSRSVAKWLEGSSFIDLAIVHYSIMQHEGVYNLLEPFLRQIRCPFMILDDNQQTFSDILISYNGSPESFESIKIFSYLFHDRLVDSNLSLIISVNNQALNLENCVYDYLRLNKRHFTMSRFFQDDYDAGVESIMEQCQNPLTVCGGNRLANLKQFLNYRNNRKDPASLFIL